MQKGGVSMNNYKKIYYDNIGEELYIFEHDSGLKCFIIKKPGYSKKHAAIAARFGSVNTSFIDPLNNDILDVPAGVAHFLEHKLFEQEYRSVMDKFSQLGASPNAYTGFTNTVYLFSCNDNFKQCLELLLNFVQNPFITDESVEKEKGIIGQEIDMYQDDGYWRCYFNLLKCLYKNNPVSIDIAGTKESISNITKEVLYTCHNTFYHPSNMMFIAVGDVVPEEVFETLDKNIVAREKKPQIQTVFPEKLFDFNCRLLTQKLSVSMPIFMIGFSDFSEKKYLHEDIHLLNREAGIKILLEIIAGRSSDFYEQLYSKGLINSSYTMEYTCEDIFGFSIIGGESTNPSEVMKMFEEHINEVKQKGISENEFDRVRKALYGRFVKQFNNVEKISHGFITAYFKNSNMFNNLQIYDTININDVNQLLDKHFNLDRLSMSVVEPL